jgi:hypothetical protein
MVITIYYGSLFGMVFRINLMPCLRFEAFVEHVLKPGNFVDLAILLDENCSHDECRNRRTIGPFCTVRG